MSGGSSARSRLLLVHPHINRIGGGSGVAAWMLQALRDEYDVTLLTWQPPDLASINDVFGTTLAAGDFACREGPAALQRMLAMAPAPLVLLRESVLMRHARRLAPAYDVVISAADEHDLGGHGIQYIHYPRFAPRPAGDFYSRYHRPLLVRAYRAAAVYLTGARMRRIAANRTLTNSSWVADLYRGVHGGPVEVLHPPAAGPFPTVPWEARANGIVCIGRIAPQKRLEYVIEIVERVRALGHDLHLHIVGVEDYLPYGAHVRALVRARAEWVTLHSELSRPALVTLLAHQRYGIHGMAAEHFGMAVAEMVAAGCIPFVPGGGGQREIVGGDPRLLFHSAADGAEQIARVVAEPALQRELREALAPQCAAFAPEYFMQRVRAIVAEHLAQR